MPIYNDVLQPDKRQLPLHEITGSGLQISGSFPGWGQAVDFAYNFNWVGSHDFGQGLFSSGSLTFVGAQQILTTGPADLTIAPSQDLFISPSSNLFKMSPNVRIQTDNYSSQTTGWAAAYNGAGDFRYIYVDELHAKAFIADLERALAGGEIISKSAAPLYQNFIAPVPGGSALLYVESFQGFPTSQVFEPGDYVMLRTFNRTGGSLVIGNAFGTVANPTIYSGGSPAYQTWTFTRLSGSVNGFPAAGYMSAGTTVNASSMSIDFGVSGNGYIESTAIDGYMGENSPYTHMVTWNTHPWYDRTVRTRSGNLYGIFASSGEYGFFAGNGVTTSSSYIRVSNQAIEGHNLPLRLYSSGSKIISLEPSSYPYLSIGYPHPTQYLQYSGIWMGRHTD